MQIFIDLWKKKDEEEEEEQEEEDELKYYDCMF